MLELLFGIVFVADALLLIGLAISVFVPEHRIWPPPEKNSWQYWITWILISVPSIGVPVVGLLDWDSLFLTHWVRFPISGILFLFSGVGIVWSLRTLSLHQTLGLKESLVTGGPYEFSRNPQYVFLIIFYIAVIVITNSILALIVGSLLVIIYGLSPLSEEPWLQEQFGSEYDEYLRRIPRFFGRRNRPRRDADDST